MTKNLIKIFLIFHKVFQKYFYLSKYQHLNFLHYAKVIQNKNLH